jgi:SNF2 family DNA or RNA helicase
MASLTPVWLGASYAPHQEFGINWMLKQERDGYLAVDAKGAEVVVRGGILGDEMGLGKTFQSLGLIVNSGVTKTLIVSPLAVRKQWEDAAAKCAVNLYIAQQWGEKWDIFPKGAVLNAALPTVHVAHYDKVSNKPRLCEGQTYDRVILDEAQTVRNANTKKARSVLEIPCKFKWGMSRVTDLQEGA